MNLRSEKIKRSGLILGGVVVAVLARLLASRYLAGYWWDLEWMYSVADWLDRAGHKGAVIHWFWIWMSLLEWLILVILGGILGLIVPRRWLILGVSCGISFVLCPYMEMCLRDPGMFGYFGLVSLQERLLLQAPDAPMLLIAAWGTSRLRRSRWAEGRCQQCGQDLTGNVSGMCSECGANITAA